MAKRINQKELDKLAPIVVEELKKTPGKDAIKQIANKYKMDQGLVRSLAKIYCVGQDKQQKELPIYLETQVVATIEENKEVKEEVMPMEQQKKERKPRVTLTDDIKLQVLELHEEGILTQKQIAEKLNISAPSVSRIIKEFSDETPVTAKEIIKEVEQKPVTNKRDFSELAKKLGINNIEGVVPFNNSILEVGLVADRHDIPINEFIYNKIDSDLMFDYSRQEEIARKFILNNIEFNSNTGEPEKQLVVYATGLQCALTSVIKICYSLEINLIIKHYDSAKKLYRSQVVFDRFSTNNNAGKFAKLLSSRQAVYTYNCQFNEFDNGDEFYILSYCSHDLGTKMINNDEGIVFKNLNDIWNIMNIVINKINEDKSVPMSVCINKALIRNDNFVWADCIVKGYNFK